MKKYMLLLLLLVSLSACSKDETPTQTVKDPSTDTVDVDQEPTTEDTTPPVITEIKQTSIQVNPNEIFTPSDYVTASDESDQLIYTSNYDQIVEESSPGSYTVTITITDASGNKTTTDVVIIIEENDPPIISVKELYAVYTTFELSDVILSIEDDHDLESDILITSDYNSVVTSSAGTFDVTVTATDKGGLSSSAVVRVYKANDAITQLYNFAYTNVNPFYRPYYGSSVTYMNYDFPGGILQLDVYTDGLTYMFFTDQTGRDYALKWNYVYGDLFDGTLSTTCQEDLSDSFQFSIDEATQVSSSTLQVNVTYVDNGSTYNTTVDLANAELRAESYFYELLLELNDYYSDEIQIPLT